MGHIYWEKREIPCPPDTHPDKGRVLVWRNIGGGQKKKLDIGRYARKEDNMFYPNENFRIYYPELWEEHYGEADKLRYCLGIGLYAATLAVGHKTGVYRCVYDAFEPLYGNAIMDYAMYSIKERSNAAYLFKPCMAGSVIFSKDRNDDDWLSDVFTNKITDEMISDFRVRWIRKCKENGITKVWIAIDGSNSNHESKTSSLGKKGKAKSGENVPIVGYIWAIAEDGTPITFFVNPGDTVDSKAFMEICTFIKSYGMEIAGIIIDKGFLTHNVLALILDSGYDYVVNLKEDNHAHEVMYDRYWQTIFMNTDYLVKEGGLFGISSPEPIKLFTSYDDEAYIALYYDTKNGPPRQIALLDKILAAKRKAEQSILEGKKPSISSDMADYLQILAIDVEDSPREEGRDETISQNQSEKSAVGTDGLTAVPNPQTKPSETVLKPEISISKDGTDLPASSEENGDVKTVNTASETGSGEVQGEGDGSIGDGGESGAETGAGEETKATEGNLPSGSPKQYKVIANPETGKASLMRKGFSSLASSRNMTATEMNRIYDIRDVSEKAYMISKSMLGYEVFRAHDDKGTETRELICFVAAIIRNDLEKACKKHKLKPCRYLEELDDKAFLMLMGDGSYIFIDKRSEHLKRLFAHYGYNKESFEILAGDVNERIRAKRDNGGAGVSQFHDEPSVIKERNEKQKGGGKGAAPQEQGNTEDSGEVQPKRKRGRPPGRKNNKTLEKEALEGSVKAPKRGRGRPPGRKNNKTLQREAEMAPPSPRKRGRPVGSKDSKPRKRRTKEELQNLAK